MFRLPTYTQTTQKLGQLRHTLIGKARELAGRFERVRTTPGAEADPLRPVIELHPAIRRRMQRRLGRRLNPLALFQLSRAAEQQFIAEHEYRRAARQARRRAARLNFNPGGNAHQRRLRRRASFRALASSVAAA